MRILSWLFKMTVTLTLFFVAPTFANIIRDYTVKRTPTTLTIDGKLDDAPWLAAELSESFVKQQTGSAVSPTTQFKMLWDDDYLYIGFICNDSDIWATYTDRDSYLWNEEVVEIMCDPNGDGLNYFELQVNPLGTEVDLLMSRAYSAGGSADFNWDIKDVKTAVFVDGTLNNVNNTDNVWTCEIAIPFSNIRSLISPQSVPPVDGENWRILPTRYNRPRDENGNETGDPQTSAWNPTFSATFHVPSKFGQINFSSDLVINDSAVKKSINTINSHEILNAYPNPFNPATTISYQLAQTGNVSISIHNALGKKVVTLVSEQKAAGSYTISWNAGYQPSGLYFVSLETEHQSVVQKVMLIK